VLTKNSFGRSVLTEAFQSKDSDTIALCLNHKTAEEERLIPDSHKNTTTATAGQSVDGAPTTVFRCTADGDGDGAAMDVEEQASATDNAVVHNFEFAPEAVGGAVRCTVRELPIDRADTPFGSDVAPADDTTGLAIWPASILLSHWLVEELRPVLEARAEVQREVSMLELGAGCGLPGLAAALHALGSACPSTVYITDIHSNSIENCRHNVLLNGYKESGSAPAAVAGLPPTTTYSRDHSTVVVQYMGWNEPQTYPATAAHRQLDVIIGSDLVYEIRILDYLIPTIRALLRPGGVFYYIAPEEGRQGMVEFLAALTDMNSASASASADSSKLVLVSQIDCPDRYYQNPFAASDENLSAGVDRDDAFVLHFYDLAAKKKHILYKFQKIE
jgi:predicted nicotinamide N-methyase